jgi:hypothetical protein
MVHFLFSKVVRFRPFTERPATVGGPERTDELVSGMVGDSVTVFGLEVLVEVDILGTVVTMGRELIAIMRGSTKGSQIK